jgi:hypothetical protein
VKGFFVKKVKKRFELSYEITKCDISLQQQIISFKNINMKKTPEESDMSNENEVVQVVPAEHEVTIIRNIKIEEVLTDKIKPDPNQPRSFIDDEKLREMAQSIVTVGIINPVEIDESFTIITGEMRWRAAKLAGLKTVPAKIVENISTDERFMRQVIENVQNYEMSFNDEAKAFDKIIKQRQEKLSEDCSHGEQSTNLPARVGQKYGKTRDIGVRWLAEMIGKSPAYVEERLSFITDSSEKFKKSVESGKVYVKFHRAIKGTPEKYKKEVEEKILNNEFKTREEAMTLVSALKREEENPQTAKKLLDTDYSKYNGLLEVNNVVSEISPTTSEMIEQSLEPRKKISKISRDLRDWVMNNPEDSIKNDAPRIKEEMEAIRTSVRIWFRDPDYLANDEGEINN